ncbi:hypothetical protein NMG60_11005249 [Bertholletia excelsa]
MKAKALWPCTQIHAALFLSGSHRNTQYLNSLLVGVYAGCGDVSSARLVFKETKYPSVFAFNWMISALAFNGYYEDAIGYFSLLKESVNLPNSHTFSIMLKVCVGLMDLNKGKEIHAMTYKMGFESDPLTGNALIDAYCKCRNTGYARRVFEKMPTRDVASWTSIICGYSNEEDIGQSVALFDRMKLEGLEPNDFTWNAMIVACARRGDCDGAHKLFSSMTSARVVPDLATWNAVISGFVQSGQNDEAVNLFREMLNAGIKPNHITVTGLLPLCGFIGSLTMGKAIHGLIYRMQLYVNNYVASALIDMYSKCGSVVEARNIFDKIHVKNVVLWNAMIGCYGKHGMTDLLIQLFDRMQEEKIQGNQVTFTCLLSACSHGGLLEKGLKIFNSMRQDYGVEASKEHYACVIDLLCRSGRMDEAYEMMKEMQIEVADSVAGAFFNGCKIHNRRDLAKILAEDTLKMEFKTSGGFVAFSNIYAAGGEWEEVENLRNLMKIKGVHKKPGFSWFEKRGFSADENSKESSLGHVSAESLTWQKNAMSQKFNFREPGLWSVSSLSHLSWER